MTIQLNHYVLRRTVLVPVLLCSGYGLKSPIRTGLDPPLAWPSISPTSPASTSPPPQSPVASILQRSCLPFPILPTLIPLHNGFHRETRRHDLHRPGPVWGPHVRRLREDDIGNAVRYSTLLTYRNRVNMPHQTHFLLHVLCLWNY